MKDLIERQAAIDAVTPFDDEYRIRDAIENLPSAQPKSYREGYLAGFKDAQSEPRWIPWNSGRFPEESGTYTVTAYDGKTKRVTYAKYQKRLKRWELTGARAYWRVLAWMPLPEPYKEK